jgi:hypothetical protein
MRAGVIVGSPVVACQEHETSRLAVAARRHGDAISVYAERLLDTDLLWNQDAAGQPTAGADAPL